MSLLKQEKVMSEDKNKEVCDIIRDITLKIKNNNEKLVSFSKDILNIYLDNQELLGYLINVAEVVEAKDKMFLSEINKLREEVVRQSATIKGLEFDMEEIKKENNSKLECVDCHEVDEYQEGEEGLSLKVDMAIEYLTNKINNGEIAMHEYQSYMNLLNHGNPVVRKDTLIKLGLYSPTINTDVIHPDDQAILDTMISDNENNDSIPKSIAYTGYPIPGPGTNHVYDDGWGDMDKYYNQHKG